MAKASRRIQRSPLGAGTRALHDEVTDAYRDAHSLPRHGIDPLTGMQLGPSDSDIRFGGLADQWLRERSSVPAPAAPPALAERGTADVDPYCRAAHSHDDPDRFSACRRHRFFVKNMLPQAVGNLRAVRSPYSEAMARLYASVLPIPDYAEPQVNGPSVFAPGTPGDVRIGASTFALSTFGIGFHQRMSDQVAVTRDRGGNVFTIDFNELHPAIAWQRQAEVEAAMVHEATHVFSSLVEADNAARLATAAGLGLAFGARAPRAAANEVNLDSASYGALQADLERAVLPFVTRILALPSAGRLAGISPRVFARVTASRMIAEAFGFAEAGVFEKQREGKAFTVADLDGLDPYYTLPAYWEPRPDAPEELADLLAANAAQVEREVKPVILRIEERYLSLRSGATP